MIEYSWTQPQCDDCWFEAQPDREPVRFKYPEVESCVTCGKTTTSGIYIRIDPSTAPNPTVQRDG